VRNHQLNIYEFDEKWIGNIEGTLCLKQLPRFEHIKWLRFIVMGEKKRYNAIVSKNFRLRCHKCRRSIFDPKGKNELSYSYGIGHATNNEANALLVY
jgi:hypothetical protein